MYPSCSKYINKLTSASLYYVAFNISHYLSFECTIQQDVHKGQLLWVFFLGMTTLGAYSKPMPKLCNYGTLICLLSGGCWHGWPLSHFGSCSISWWPTATTVAAYRQVQLTVWQMKPAAEVVIYWECELGHQAVELCWRVRSVAAHFFQIQNDISPKDLH